MSEYEESDINHDTPSDAPVEDSAADSEEIYASPERKPVNRTSVLLFAILIIGAAGYYFMYLRTGPQAASASTDAALADATINQYLAAGDENIRAIRQLRDTTDKVVAQFRNDNVAQIPVSALLSNPFRYAAPTVDANTDESTARKRREEQRQAAILAVQQLHLQTIVHGDSRRACMINNALYTEGNSVNGFVIEKISSNSIIVRQNVFRFEIKMQP